MQLYSNMIWHLNDLYNLLNHIKTRTAKHSSNSSNNNNNKRNTNKNNTMWLPLRLHNSDLYLNSWYVPVGGLWVFPTFMIMMDIYHLCGFIAANHLTKTIYWQADNFFKQYPIIILIMTIHHVRICRIWRDYGFVKGWSHSGKLNKLLKIEKQEIDSNAPTLSKFTDSVLLFRKNILITFCSAKQTSCIYFEWVEQSRNIVHYNTTAFKAFIIITNKYQEKQHTRLLKWFYMVFHFFVLLYTYFIELCFLFVYRLFYLTF